MNKINVGDYVIFNHNGSKITGLVNDVIKAEGSVKFEIVPSAIGFDYYPVVESDQVKKAGSKYEGKTQQLSE